MDIDKFSLPQIREEALAAVQKLSPSDCYLISRYIELMEAANIGMDYKVRLSRASLLQTEWGLDGKEGNSPEASEEQYNALVRLETYQNKMASIELIYGE